MANTGDESDKEAPRLWRFANAVFDESRWELVVDGLTVEIEPRPLELLRCLLRHAGEVLDKRELMDALYGHSHITEAALTNAVTKLRRALRDTDQTLIVTVHRVGYRLAGNVRSEELRGSLATPQTYSADMPVPGRPNWILRRALGVHRSAEVWLATHAKTTEQRVFKFSLDGRGLSALKREVTLFRVLRETLGEREDFATLIDWHLNEPPFYLESAWGGINLAEWSLTDARFAAMPQAERVALIAGIAETVAAAHSAGVLHKDLKPANVLVYDDASGQPKLRVTDFGSGRLLMPEQLARIGITQLGFTQTQRVTGDSGSGTPLYLAPEVLAGESPTSQSDVYALGVMLYQAAIGDFRRPLTAGWEADIDDELLREDIRLAANGSAARRLASAQQLAERLRRLPQRREAAHELQRLQQRAQQAERELVQLRARRRLQLTAAALMAIGALVSSVLFWRAHRAEIQARDAEARAVAVRDFLVSDVLKWINVNQRPSQSLTVRQLLDVAAAQVDSRFSGQTLLQAEIHASVGTAMLQLDAPGDARGELLKAFELLQARQPRELARTLAIAPDALYSIINSGDLRERFPTFDALLTESRRQFGDTHEDVLRLMLEVARADAFLSRPEQADARLRELLPLAERHGDPEFIGRVHLLQGFLHTERARYADAAGDHAEALKQFTTAYGSDGMMTARAAGMLALDLCLMGQTQRSQQLFDDAVRGGLHWWGDFQGQLANIRYAQAQCALHRHDPQPVIDFTRQFVEHNGYEQNHWLVLLGDALLQAQRYSDAETKLAKLIDIDTRFFGAQSQEVTAARIALAEVLVRSNHAREAQKLLASLPTDALQQLPSPHPLHARRQFVDSLICLGLHQHCGIAGLDQAQAEYTQLYGPDHWRVAEIKRYRTQFTTDAPGNRPVPLEHPKENPHG